MMVANHGLYVVLRDEGILAIGRPAVARSGPGLVVICVMCAPLVGIIRRPRPRYRFVSCDPDPGCVAGGQVWFAVG